MKRTLFFFALLLSAAAADEQTTEEWQRKAVAEFPDLAVEGSALHQKFLELYQARAKTDPVFFRRPDWPYRLAKECAPASPAIIPGLDALRPPGGMPPASPAASAPRSGRTFLQAAQLHDAISSGDNSSMDQRLKISGVVKRLEVPPLGRNDVFYVVLNPDVICEFHTDAILSASPAAYGIPRDVTYWWDYYYPHNPRYKVRVEPGRVIIMRAADYRNGKYVNFRDVKEIFLPGTQVTLEGTCGGLGAFGVLKGIVMRDCTALEK